MAPLLKAISIPERICLLPCAECSDLEKKVAEYRKASAIRP
jgi:hypothetical protein